MVAKKVESLKNPLVREALDIQKKRRQYKHEAFLLEGLNLVASALEPGGMGRVKRVFATPEFMERNQGLMRLVSRSGAELVEVTEAVIHKLSTTEFPQGIAALASYHPPALERLELKGVTTVCDGIQDPGNLGTIIRTSDALGCDAVVLLPGTCDAFSSKTLRATAGSIFHIPLVYGDAEGIINGLRKRGVKLAITVPRSDVSLAEADLSPPVALVFGNEAAGTSPQMRSAADLAVHIPIPGRAESLNVAVSAAICLYEASRQCEKCGP